MDRLKDLPAPQDGPVVVDLQDGGKPITLKPPVYVFGRPTDYTPQLAARLVEQVRLGRTPTEICELDDWAPSQAVFYRWKDQYPDFREALARARVAGAEVMADRGLDFIDKADDTNKNAILKASRQAEYRFRMAAVYDRKFSDRQIVTHEDANGPQAIDMSTKELGLVAQQLVRLLSQASAVDVESVQIKPQPIEDKGKSGK